MAILKRKTQGGGWSVVTEAEDFPTPVPVEITEVQADLVSLTVTTGGRYYPQSPHNGFTDVFVNIPTYDGTVV